MKKFCMMFLALFTVIAANAWTVKFTNPNSWANVYAYVWDDAENKPLGSWPGTAMTKGADGVWTISSTTGNPTKVIFNNNSGGQTPNLTFVDGATYDFYGLVGAQKESYSVYFDNSKSNWAKVYCYTYGPELFGGWAGTEITTKNSDGLYVVTIEATSDPSDMGGLIFSNGTGGTKGVDQTNDLKWETGATYNVSGKVTGTGGDEPVTPPATGKPEYVNIGSDNWAPAEYWNGVAVTGSTVSWTDLNLGDQEFAIKTWSSAAGDGFLYATNIKPGVATALEAATSQTPSTIEGAAAGDKYNVTIDLDNTTITVTKVGGGDEPVTPPTPGEDKITYVNIGSDNWAPAEYWNGKAVSADYTATWSDLDLGGAEFAIKTWNDKVDGFLYATDIPVGTATALTAATSQTPSTIAGAAAGDKYNVTIDLNTNTITVTKVGGGDEPVTPPTPGEDKITYVNIGSDNWAPAEYWNGVAVSADYTATWSDLDLGDAEFAIKTWNNKVDGFLYATNIPVGTATALTAATSQTPSTIAGAAAGDKYNVTIDLNTNTITVTKVGGGDEPVTPPTPGEDKITYVNIGSDNWAPAEYWDGKAVSEDYTVTWSDLDLGDAEFAIKTWNNKVDGFLYATNIPVGTATALTAATSQTPSTIAGAAAGDKYNVTIDLNTNTITVTKVGGGDEPITPPNPSAYEWVNIGSDNWAPAEYWNGVKVEGSTVSWTNLNLGGQEFAIKTWDGTADGYLYAINIKPGVATALTPADAQTPSTIEGAVAGDKYNVTIDLDNTTITVTKSTTGVEGIYMDGEENAVYFNLQGVKVANPTSGIYVRVSEGKATKVTIK